MYQTLNTGIWSFQAISYCTNTYQVQDNKGAKGCITDRIRIEHILSMYISNYTSINVKCRQTWYENTWELTLNYVGWHPLTGGDDYK